MVKNPRPARNQVKVTMRHRIEAAGIDRFNFVQRKERSTAIVRSAPPYPQFLRALIGRL